MARRSKKTTALLFLLAVLFIIAAILLVILPATQESKDDGHLTQALEGYSSTTPKITTFFTPKKKMKTSTTTFYTSPSTSTSTTSQPTVYSSTTPKITTSFFTPKKKMKTSTTTFYTSPSTSSSTTSQSTGTASLITSTTDSTTYLFPIFPPNLSTTSTERTSTSDTSTTRTSTESTTPYKKSSLMSTNFTSTSPKSTSSTSTTTSSSSTSKKTSTTVDIPPTTYTTTSIPITSSTTTSTTSMPSSTHPTMPSTTPSTSTTTSSTSSTSTTTTTEEMPTTSTDTTTTTTTTSPYPTTEMTTTLTTSPTTSTTESTSTDYTSKSFSKSYTKIIKKKPEPKPCLEPGCLNLASKMVHMVNHEQDRCTSFSEYACGGLEMDQQFFATTVEDEIRQRLKKQFWQNPNETAASTFYAACINQRETLVQAQAIEASRAFLKELEVHLNSDSHHLTDAIKFLLERQINPYFEITLEWDEPELEYVPVLRYALSDSSLSQQVERVVCKEELHEIVWDEEFHGDLRLTYDNYTNCFTSGKGMEAKIQRIEESCTLFFPEDRKACENALNITQDINNRLFHNWPRMISDMKETRRLRDYDDVFVVDLYKESSDMILWTSLFKDLFKDYGTVDNIKIYGLYSELKLIISHLSDEFKNNPDSVKDFYRIMVAERLYTYLVNPLTNGNAEQYCLDNMQELMPKESVDLLTESFTKKEKEISVHIFEKSLGILRKLGLKKDPEKDEDKSKEEYDPLLSIGDVELSSTNHPKNVLTLLKRNQEFALSFISKPESSKSHLFIGDVKPADYKLKFGKIKIQARALMEPNMYFLKNLPDYLNMAGAARILIAQDLRIFTELSDDYGCRLPRTTENFVIQTSKTGIEKNMTIPVTGKIIDDLLVEVVTTDLIFKGTFSDMPEEMALSIPWISKDKKYLTAKEAFLILSAQTYCSSSNLIEEILELFEDAKLPVNFRLNAISQLMASESVIFECKPTTSKYEECFFAESGREIMINS